MNIYKKIFKKYIYKDQRPITKFLYKKPVLRINLKEKSWAISPFIRHLYYTITEKIAWKPYIHKNNLKSFCRKDRKI